MQCRFVRAAISLQGYRASRLDSAQRAHLAECEPCRAWHAEEILKVALQRPSVPDPSPAFVDQALARAAREHRHRVPRTLWSAAAAVILTVAVALLAGIGPGEDTPATAALAAQGPRIVNVVIEAKEQREDATVTVRLAKDLELEGFEGQHLIQWQTTLAKGRNLLALPVRSKTGAGGDVRIALSYDGSNRSEMRISLSAG